MRRVDEFRALQDELGSVLVGKRTSVRFNEHRNDGSIALVIEPTGMKGLAWSETFLDRFAAAIRAHEATLIKHVLDEARAAAIAEATEARIAADEALTMFLGPTSSQDQGEKK